MKPSYIAETIAEVAIKRNIPVMIWGPPGVGKSAVVKQACATLEFDMVDFRMIYRDPVDMLGLPGARDGQTFYNLPAGLPKKGPRPQILFLDEIVSAPAQAQASAYQLTHERRVGDYVLPDDCYIVAAGNRVNDRGVVHRMPDPLADRFQHVDYEVDVQDWCQWALGAGIVPEVVAFIRFRMNLLHSHDTNRTCHAFATPRGWADVSRMVGLRPEIEGDVIRGRVGDGAAGEFMAFLKLYRSMVSPDAILLNPLKAEVPTNAAVLYALSEALARRSSAKNFDAVLTYAKRMPREYAACLVSSATRITPTLCNTHEFIRWASEQTA